MGWQGDGQHGSMGKHPAAHCPRGGSLGQHAAPKCSGAASATENHKPRLALGCMLNYALRSCDAAPRSVTSRPPHRQRHCTHIRLCSRPCCSSEMA
jgi:hypothetical protein